MSIYRNGVRLSLTKATGDYAKLNDLPSINGTQLIGDITLSSTSIESVSVLPSSGMSQGKLYKYGNTLNWWNGNEWKQLGSSSMAFTDVAKAMYPVGSIYMSVTENNPATMFGGTWTMISDNFLLASGSTDVGDVGGSESVTIPITGNNTGMSVVMNDIKMTTSTMPPHTHTSSDMAGTVSMSTAMKFTGSSVTSGSAKAGITLTESAHSHSITYYKSRKSGTDDLTIYSYSENRGSYTSTTDSNTIGLTVNDLGHSHTITPKGTLSKGSYTFTGSASKSLETGGDSSKETVGVAPTVNSYVQPTFTGGNQTVNILPPYLPVYMWQRLS